MTASSLQLDEPVIRDVQEADLPVCGSWYNHYILSSTATFEEAPLTDEEFSLRAAEITASYPWIVLERDGKLCGYAYLSAFNFRSAYRFTADVAVYLNPEETGKGYGRLLMEALEERAKEKGIKKLVSLVTEGNTASERLHHSLGYRKVGTLERSGYKFGKWISVTFYEKDIGTFLEDVH